MTTFANIVLFQAVWFATIIGASKGLAWPGAAALLIFLGAHYYLSRTARVDYVLSLILVGVGIVVETLLSGGGLISYDTTGLSPAWILLLWCNLGLILNNSISWLANRPLLASILGAVGGAASYLGGVKLGAAELHVPTTTATLILAITWAILTPLLFYLARCLAGRMPVTRAE